MSDLSAADLRRIAGRLTMLTTTIAMPKTVRERIDAIEQGALTMAEEHAKMALGSRSPGTVSPPTLMRTVTIEQHSYDMAEDVEHTVAPGWRIVEGTRSIDGLTWDEMLGQIATLTHHLIERGMSLFGGMKTAEEHAADRARHEANVRKWAERVDAKPAASDPGARPVGRHVIDARRATISYIIGPFASYADAFGWMRESDNCGALEGCVCQIRAMTDPGADYLAASYLAGQPAPDAESAAPAQSAAAPLLTSNDLALAEFAANLAMCWHRAQISSSFTQEEIAKLKRLIAKLGRAGRHLNPYPDSDDMPSDWGDDAVYGPLSKAVKP